MADYFPLVSRAVSALDPNTRDRRNAIYARAREALDRQLLSLDPPIATVDLERERLALSDTIARVEAQFAPAASPLPPPAPIVPAAAVQTPAAPLPPLARPQQPAPPVVVPPKPVVNAPALAPPVAVPAPEDVTTAAHPRLIDPTENEPLVVPQRPKVASGSTRGFSGDRKKMLALALGIPVMLAIGAAAYALRDGPDRYNAQSSQAAGAGQAQAPQRKSDGRLDGSGAPAPGPRPLPPTGDKAALPVAARVLYFEETGSDPRGAQSDGQVVWRLEAVPATPGRAADTALRGTISTASAKMSLDLVIKRNREAGLPASHTVEVIFRPEEGRDGVKVIGPIEAREQETNPGYALKGAMVPIATNLFLIGLDNNELAISKNLEALRDQKWFAFQFQLVSGKIGAVLIEKGPTGERVFREALDAWK